MSWYYVEAGAQKGPLENDKFIELVTNGTIRAETLVWREGMKDWQPYAAVFGAQNAGSTPVAVSPGQAACGECGRVVPEVETVEIGGRRICASCKPVVVQRMIEGTASGTGGLDPEALLADLRAGGGYSIDIGSVVSRSFDVVKENLWPSIGVSLLMGIIGGAGGMIPFIGVFITWVLHGAVTGGTYRYFLLKVRGEGSVLNDAFSGFQAPRMKELMLAGMIVSAPSMIINLFSISVQLISIFQMRQMDPGFESAALPGLIAAMGGLGLIAIAFGLLWTPALMILSDEPIGFWKALELSRRLVMQRPFSWIGLYIVMGLLSIAGMLALCVGIFFVIPMLSVILVMVWDDIRNQAAAARQLRGAGTI